VVGAGVTRPRLCYTRVTAVRGMHIELGYLFLYNCVVTVGEEEEQGIAAIFCVCVK